VGRVTFRAICRSFYRSVSSLGPLDAAVEGGAGDPERPADCGGAGLPAVVEGLGQRHLLEVGQGPRPATDPPPAVSRRRRFDQRR
jgi:hypothetical protein